MDTLFLHEPTLYQALPAWVLVLIAVGAMVAALEVGFRTSRERAPEGNSVPMQTFVLGLSSLLLAFSFSATQVRYDERRNLAVKEANAIGTLYLRAGYLPPESRLAMRKLLREYLELHLAATETGQPRGRVIAMRLQNDRVHEELWRILQGQVKTLHPTVLLLATNAMNAVIDVSAERWAAAMARLPWLVLLMLFLTLTTSALLIGHQPELAQRQLKQWTLFLVTTAVVLLTLLDLDRPTRGVIHTSQQPLADLLDSLRKSEP